jgi:hypothetical protein
MSISGVTHREQVLSSVPSQPRDQEWVYQLTIPFQLSATEVGLMVNIRRGSVRTVDLEIGSDLVILDGLDRVGTERVVPLSRGDVGPNPLTGRPTFFARYPLVGGFVPLGARRADGLDHPHQGTGFSVATVIGFPADRDVGGHWELPDDEKFHALEMQQYSYDGQDFVRGESRIVALEDLLPGWRISGPGLCHAVADGDDLLMPCGASADGGKSRGGLLRWQRLGDVWRPVIFHPVTPADSSYEATVVRDMDGALLFTARGGADVSAIRLWRGSCDGAKWESMLTVSKMRSETPVSLNRAADGTVYVAGSPEREVDSRGRALSSVEMREKLLLWPISADRRALLEPVTARDCLAEFGEAPGESIWRADHPVGLTVRLAGRQWHHVLCYRVLASDECVSDAPVTTRTGAHVEELYTDGPSLPLWEF